MKKLFLAIGGIVLLGSCTENTRVKQWGGEGTINLPKGTKLVTVTWKGDQVWYLTKPMDSSDVAETYQFQEESSWGLIEGTYNIVETK
jgi:hypothetical protein